MKSKEYSRSKKEPKNYMAEKYSPMEERYQTSLLTLKIRSFGNDMQHTKTISTILRELELRGFDFEIVEQ